MSILEKLQKEYDNTKNCETRVEIDRVEILSDGDETDKNLMSPPKVGQDNSGDVQACELLRQFMKAQEDANKKLEESLTLKLNEFRRETNEKIKKLYQEVYSESDNDEPVTKKSKTLMKEKKGERRDSRPTTENEDDKAESRPNNFYDRLSEKFVDVEKTGH